MDTWLDYVASGPTSRYWPMSGDSQRFGVIGYFPRPLCPVWDCVWWVGFELGNVEDQVNLSHVVRKVKLVGKGANSFDHCEGT